MLTRLVSHLHVKLDLGTGQLCRAKGIVSVNCFEQYVTQCLWHTLMWVRQRDLQRWQKELVVFAPHPVVLECVRFSAILCHSSFPAISAHFAVSSMYDFFFGNFHPVLVQVKGGICSIAVQRQVLRSIGLERLQVYVQAPIVLGQCKAYTAFIPVDFSAQVWS
jgi:hypothetical protein